MIRGLVARWRRRNWVPSEAARRFEGRRPFTVVTGASRGLGRALAGRFAAAGDNLLLVARGAEDLGRAAGELAPHSAGEIETLALDLVAPDAGSKLAERLKQLNGYADILVNNAGLGYSGRFARQSEVGLDRLIALDVRALSELMRRFLPDMLVRGRGGILNVASLAGFAPGPYQAAYYASKAYVIALTEAVAHEEAGKGVRICAFAPGPIATDFHADMGAEKAYYLRFMGLAGAERASAVGYYGFKLGLVTVVPIGIPFLAAVALRLLPHRISVPFIGWLLKPDRAERH